MHNRPFSDVLRGLGFVSTPGTGVRLTYNQDHGVVAFWDESGRLWWMPADTFNLVAAETIDHINSYGVTHNPNAEVPEMIAAA
jgi:hypothetical protein